MEQLQTEGIRNPSILLGSVIDEKGNEVKATHLNDFIDKNITSLSLDDLRERSNLMPIWLMAAGKHKRIGVISAIRGKIVNSIIIDSDIANNILDNI
jgi:DNA-binding transcriptional regulator LsrR (DeoR family)